MSLKEIFTSVYNFLFFKKKNIKTFTYCTRRLRIMMLVMGIGPIWMNSRGRMLFKWTSWRMVYSMTMFASIICFTTTYLYWERVNQMMNLVNDFDAMIHNVMFMSFGKTTYLLPLLGWYSSRDLANYHNMWSDFERKYFKKFKQHLNLGRVESTVNLYLVIYAVFLVTLLGGQLFTLPTYTLQESLAYIPSGIQTFVYLGITHVYCVAVSEASEILRRRMLLAFSRKHVTQEVIIVFKHFWIELNFLTQHIGVVLSAPIVVIIASTFVDLTISSYGFLHYYTLRVKSNKEAYMSIQEVGMLFASFTASYVIFHVNNTCYLTTLKVEEIKDDLLMATVQPHHPRVIKEIELFLEVVHYNPPLISLCDCIILCRKSFTKIISMVLANLIVLIQLKIGYTLLFKNNPKLNY